MTSSRFSKKYRLFLEQLRDTRKKKKLSQVQVARLMKVPQQYISRFELGETRMDIVQLYDYCEAIDTSFSNFCTVFEEKCQD